MTSRFNIALTDENKNTVNGVVEPNVAGLHISLDGYSNSAQVGGCIITLELHNGQARLLVFSDVNKDEPQIIPLGGAREMEREGW